MIHSEILALPLGTPKEGSLIKNMYKVRPPYQLVYTPH